MIDSIFRVEQYIIVILIVLLILLNLVMLLKQNNKTNTIERGLLAVQSLGFTNILFLYIVIIVTDGNLLNHFWVRISIAIILFLDLAYRVYDYIGKNQRVAER